ARCPKCGHQTETGNLIDLPDLKRKAVEDLRRDAYQVIASAPELQRSVEAFRANMDRVLSLPWWKQGVETGTYRVVFAGRNREGETRNREETGGRKQGHTGLFVEWRSKGDAVDFQTSEMLQQTGHATGGFWCVSASPACLREPAADFGVRRA